MRTDALLLCLDTSGETLSLGLGRGRQVLAEYCGGQPRQHLVQLFPALELLCQQVQVSLGSLEGVVVTAGPGSFTGLRTGLLIAKTLSQTLKIPIFPLDTLQVLANGCPGLKSVVVALDARKGEICWATYDFEQGLAQSKEPQQLSRPVQFLEQLLGGARVLGSACKTYGEQFQVRADVVWLPDEFARPRVAAMLRLVDQTPAMAWTEVEPGYLRAADVQVQPA